MKDKKMSQVKKEKSIKIRLWVMKGVFLGLNMIIAFLLGWPINGLGADGYWWGSAITPGFDRSTGYSPVI